MKYFVSKRNCYVTDVGIAIEKLVVALDPECEKPFVGDILDLLEWAEKDVLEMRAEIERLKTVPMKYRRMAFNAQLQNENTQLCQQLAAAHAARVSAQASGIRLLDQLTEAKEECDTLRRIHAENIAILERKTAQAVAACKLKDEALEHIALIDLGRDTLPTDFCMNVLSVRKALTIQPDDSALKAWLGEPVGEVKRHTGSLKDMAIIVWAGQQPEEGTKLYSPKGLK